MHCIAIFILSQSNIYLDEAGNRDSSIWSIKVLYALILPLRRTGYFSQIADRLKLGFIDREMWHVHGLPSISIIHCLN